MCGPFNSSCTEHSRLASLATTRHCDNRVPPILRRCLVNDRTWNILAPVLDSFFVFSILGNESFLCVSIFVLGISTILIVVLYGWSVQWWLLGEPVDAVSACLSLPEVGGLSTAAVGFCLCWALFLFVSEYFILWFGEMFDIRERKSFLLEKLRGSFHPAQYFEKHPSRTCLIQGPDTVARARYDILHEIAFGLPPSVDEDMKEYVIKSSPLHFRNAVVHHDDLKVSSYEFCTPFIQIVLILAVLPIQICAVSAVFSLRKKLNEATFRILRHIVDSITVLSLIGFAIAFKLFLSSFGYARNDSNLDHTRTEPKAEARGKAFIRRT